MKWQALLFLAAASVCGHAVSESQLNSGTSESTLTESQCSETVKKVQASGKYTEDAILPICSSEVKSSKCDFFAEALSLASTHADFTSKVFCKDIAEAHTCSQMMDNLYESITTKDLLFGECMRSQDGKSEQYCMKFKSLLGRAVHESDLDTMRACYMMQAYDEKEGPIDSKPSPAKPEVKKESKEEKAAKEPKKEKAASKAPSKPKVNMSLSHLKQAPPKPKASQAHPKPKANAKHEVMAQHANVSATHKPGAKSSQTKKHETNSVVAKTISNHDASHRKSAVAKTISTAHKDSKAAKATNASAKKHSVGSVTNTSKGKLNATDAKNKVTALAKTNATTNKSISQSNQTKIQTEAEKKADEKKYGGFLSGFVL